MIKSRCEYVRYGTGWGMGLEMWLGNCEVLTTGTQRLDSLPPVHTTTTLHMLVLTLGFCTTAPDLQNTIPLNICMTYFPSSFTSPIRKVPTSTKIAPSVTLYHPHLVVFFLLGPIIYLLISYPSISSKENLSSQDQGLCLGHCLFSTLRAALGIWKSTILEWINEFTAETDSEKLWPWRHDRRQEQGMIHTWENEMEA